MPANRWVMLMLGAVLGTAATTAWPATQGQIDSARNKGLWWLFTHQNGEGRWGSSSAASVATTAAALEALNTAGLRGPLYARGYSWLANAPTISVDSLARQIGAVGMSGGDTTRLVANLLSARNSFQAWGSYAKYDTSFPDTALALNALLPSPAYSTADVQNTVCQIIGARRADGGWSYAAPMFPGMANSSILPTVYNMLAMDAARSSRGLANSYPCSGFWTDISGTLNGGTAWLLTQKNADNGFGAGGASSVIETAFAYQALKQLKPTDPATDSALDYLVSHQNAADGSWGGDAFQTALVMKLLPPPPAPLADTDKDGVPDVVEALAGTNPGVANGRGIALGNGQSVAGVTVPVVLAGEAILGQVFSFTISISGTPPYTWSITTGGLPPGLVLNTGTGVISGTPTTLGSYSFAYTVTDAASAVHTVVGQINVYRSSPSLATGDINGDGVVDAADVLLAERMALGLITPNATQKQRADVAPIGNPDGVIDLADVVRIQRKALGLENW